MRIVRDIPYEDLASITCIVETDDEGLETLSYEWEGRWDALVWFSTLAAMDYPFPPYLRYVGENALGDRHYYAHKNIAWWWISKAGIYNRYVFLRSRIVRTLIIWGLAYVGPGEMIGWSAVGKKKP